MHSIGYFFHLNARTISSRHIWEMALEPSAGQVLGVDRREIKQRFENPEDPPDVLVCPPPWNQTSTSAISRSCTCATRYPALRTTRKARGAKVKPRSSPFFAASALHAARTTSIFYRQPGKIISGKIVAPCFMFDNETLPRSHIHSSGEISVEDHSRRAPVPAHGSSEDHFLRWRAHCRGRFYYPSTVVFMDGSPHHLDWAPRDDAEKRRRLRLVGLRVLVVRGDSLANRPA